MRPSPPPRSSGVFSSSAPPTAVRRLALSRRGSAENAVLLTCRSLWLSGRLTMAFARWLAARASPPCLPARSPVTCECSEIFSQLCALGRFFFFFAEFVTSEHSAILVLPDCGRGHFLFLFFVLMARCTSYVFPARSRAGYLGGELDSDADLVKVLHVPSA